MQEDSIFGYLLQPKLNYTVLVLEFFQFRRLLCKLFVYYARTVPYIGYIFFLWRKVYLPEIYFIYKERIDRFDHI